MHRLAVGQLDRTARLLCRLFCQPPRSTFLILHFALPPRNHPDRLAASSKAREIDLRTTFYPCRSRCAEHMSP